MRKKSIVVLMIAMLLTSVLFAQATAEKEEKISIGFSQVLLDSPFYVALMDQAEKTAEEMGVEFIYLDAQSNIQKQNNDILDLVNRGIDALIINPVDPDGVKPALERARQAGIPIIAVDRPVNDKVDSFVGRENYAMGKIVGELAVELLGGKGKAQGKILELQGDAGGSVMMARRDGFHEAVDAEKGIVVVQSPYCEYIRSKAVSATQDLAQAHPDIDLIYGHNDDMALGGLQVMEQLRKKVFVVGVDGLMEAVKAIVDGRYNGTAMNDPAVLGRLAVETAIKLVNGEKVPEYIDGGTNLIDKNNAAKFYNAANVFAVM
ncbi:MAG: substrate-binding domain-containing protein [Sphaerochaetaceae bacterium]|jgi:ribose transport system substrate-binding protein|nr:substrate-binding domain-containing protein [Sphaerochaetaceae bacterium]NLO60356.1 substrate-binding domain-containing protein [Spirochaetales bacterium]MDD2405707.1 substrate-binding domain-containing protein [Sphaerochaetaceae bacterium]MDD3669850.1 substrate-binding domain-containing protein [Sphaerochaetaceae bacterium]MDD4258766.1 substrate-binding domain-containing protein [Sphaerochaetaceae bacterium]